MRTRIPSVVATIVAGIMMMACSDAAVDKVTAPPLAATPAPPAMNRYPYAWELLSSGIPSTIGMQIATGTGFTADWRTFVVDAHVSFSWVNSVSAELKASLVDKAGKTVNSGSAGVSWYRLLLPVASGDTTFSIRLPTNGITCGLTGKHSYSGTAAQVALNINAVQIPVYSQKILETTGLDISQPDCPPPAGCEEPATRVISGSGALLAASTDCDAPSPPNGGGVYEAAIEVCYTIWRQLWIFDYLRRTLDLVAEWPLGVHCYYDGLMT